MLKTPNQLLLTPDSSGIQPHGYKVEFADDGQENWTQRVVQLQQVDFGYGSDPFTAQMLMWDPATIEAPNIVGNRRSEVMATPVNGERVRIWHYDWGIRDYTLAFKGSVKSVHDRKTETGLQYVVTAISEVVRLDESHVTFTANLYNDPINPSPFFNGNGYLVGTVLRTVKELVDQVLIFPDAWGRPQHFTPEMVDWRGLDTDHRLGLFKPSNLVFNDTGKGQAIQTIIESAGNFTFLYVPGVDQNPDRLVIVELNLACNRCGPQWNIPFVSVDRQNPAYIAPYASDHRIMSDNTEWSSKMTANVVRMTSGQIRFYSGHYYLPERLDPWAAATIGPDDAGDTAADTRNMVIQGNDTFGSMDKRSYNSERTWYRFSGPNAQAVDLRKLRQFVTGLPLFPDWNVHEDYVPDLVRISNVMLNGDNAVNPNGFTATNNADVLYANYIGAVEWNMQLLGDSIAHKSAKVGRAAHLRQWQAYWCPQDCPACAGTGSVKKVYTNTDNEPAFTFYACGPAGERIINISNFTLQQTEVIVARVNNYIFDPKKFGERDPLTNQIWAPTGLEAWEHTDAQPYPIPWKNLCPYCRGVGKKPEYKIRNIRPDLFSGRNPQVAVSGTDTPGETPLDPDQTTIGPESWEQAQSRIMFNQQAFVQVEQPWETELPEWTFRNKRWEVLTKLTDDENKNRDLNTEADSRRFKFPHPLQFKTVKRLLAMKYGVTGVDAQLAPDDWYSYAPYTTVNNIEDTVSYNIDYSMGRVQFGEPQFIPCVKQFQVYQYDGQKKTHLVERTGMLALGARVQITNDPHRWHGYFRPARVWMSFFYVRDHYYDTGSTNPLNAAPIKTTFCDFENDDGQLETYAFRAMILDGRYAVEVQKVTADAEQEMVSSLRVVQACYNDDAVPIETSENDFWKMSVPPDPSLDEPALEAKKKELDLDFPRGKFYKLMMTTAGEKLRETDGVSEQDFRNSVFRPKIFTWRMRDGRPRLMQLAIRRLEQGNNLTVSGQLVLNGVSNDLTQGLGFVDYPDKGRAAVKRLTYDYNNGFECTLELARERARIGELPPTEKQILNQVIKDVMTLKRERASGYSGSRPSMNNTGNEDTDISDDSGSSGAKILFY